MKFKIKADAIFEAEDMASAMATLSTHFHWLSIEEDSDLIEKGLISVEPADQNKSKSDSTQIIC